MPPAERIRQPVSTTIADVATIRNLPCVATHTTDPHCRRLRPADQTRTSGARWITSHIARPPETTALRSLLRMKQARIQVPAAAAETHPCVLKAGRVRATSG